MGNLFYRQLEKAQAKTQSVKRPYKIRTGSLQLILLVGAILLFRVLYVVIYTGLQTEYGFDLYDYVFDFMRDYPTLFLGLGLNILFIYLLNRVLKYGKSPFKRLALIFIYLVFVSVLLVFILKRFRLVPWESRLYFAEFLICFLAVLILNAIVVIILDVLSYFRHSRRQLAAEMDKRHKAIYQYDQLKRQLNPHFLFNSLNILDYLVHQNDPQRASDFIKKLAGVYRYLLSKGEEKLVTVKEEVDFLDMYAELLKERFTEGLEINIDIPKTSLKRNIIPCGLQILVENATKHNIVNQANPLRVNIFTEGENVVVRNNLQPRLSSYESTGVGLSNIRGQYADIAEIHIEVVRTESEFIVKLPLL